LLKRGKEQKHFQMSISTLEIAFSHDVHYKMTANVTIHQNKKSSVLSTHGCERERSGPHFNLALSIAAVSAQLERRTKRIFPRDKSPLVDKMFTLAALKEFDSRLFLRKFKQTRETRLFSQDSHAIHLVCFKFKQQTCQHDPIYNTLFSSPTHFN
jgi:hypothetical protein